MAADKADEVMAEYLLKGGKMLAKSCKVCGYPLFEYKGKTQCVICPLTTSETSLSAPASPEPTQSPSPAPAVPTPQNQVAAEIEQTIIRLCERIQNEQRADECLALMTAVEKGAKALKRLGQR
ncbi:MULTISPECIES: Sjogren's syndrome/scleroderma autoantigen 1 family protein [unclassified Methanoculleus]|uniref:Sjogren's syndrome/scleroderma autoantigen 1 family protein n=1 Tax=unclassified Methanoculleus TaxID=2619537 RepID=UPI0025FC01B4|nr:Sjogren's syndrome/scleroderma autoantigen 1 family protein [Methanoculleus sp. UBA377]